MPWLTQLKVQQYFCSHILVMPGCNWHWKKKKVLKVSCLVFRICLKYIIKNQNQILNPGTLLSSATGLVCDFGCITLSIWLKYPLLSLFQEQKINISTHTYTYIEASWCSKVFLRSSGKNSHKIQESISTHLQLNIFRMAFGLASFIIYSVSLLFLR